MSRVLDDVMSDLEAALESQMVSQEPVHPLYPKSDSPPAPGDSADVTVGADDVVNPTQASNVDADAELIAVTEGINKPVSTFTYLN